jgi:arylsulfatase A-like enzyme
MLEFAVWRVLLVAVPALGALACETGPPPPLRSVILISLDTLRADHLGAYGYSRPTSPRLDAFAAEGVVFERAIAQASSTRPSHRSLFQSRPASATTRDGPALAESLSLAGVRTAAFTGGGIVSARLGFERGFETWEEGSGGLAWALPRVEAWLRAHQGERFFLFLHTYDIHLPYDPPAPFDSMFLPDYRGVVRGKDTRNLLRRVRGLRVRGFDDSDAKPVLTEADRRQIVALYDGGIRYADAHLGRLFDLLGSLDLWDETAVVVFSDHGEEFWDHGSVSHSHTLFQELIHVPLIFRAPALSPRRIPSVVPLLDIAPTLLDLLGLPIPVGFTGRSLLPLMTGVETQARAFPAEQRALKAWIDPPWKLVIDEDGGEPLLFHLTDDPQERQSRTREEPERVAALQARLREALPEVGTDGVFELEPGEKSPELLERLRQLGYVE